MASGSLELVGDDTENDRLVDPEAGDQDGEYEGDEDSEDYESEEEPTEAYAAQKKARPAMGKWKRQLASVSQDAVPEDMLHVVSWGRLAKHVAMNTLATLLFVVFAAVAHLPMLMSLILYLSTFLLAVTVWEVLQQCRAQVQVGSGLLAACIIIAGFVVMGPYGCISLLAQWLFVPLLIIVILLRCFEQPWRKTLHGTAVWQALSGEKWVMLTEQLDLAKLCKSIYYYRKPASKLAHRMWETASKVGMYTYTDILVRMVEVDESSNETADVLLELNGEEIEPNAYMLTELMLRAKADDPVDKLSIVELEAMLKQRKSVSDMLLDTWLNPAARAWASQVAVAAGEGGKPAKETRVEKIRKWMAKASFPPSGTSSMVARFRCANYFEGLYGHWAPRAMKCMLLCALLSVPAVHLLMDMDKERRLACGSEGASGAQSLGGVEVCGGSAEDSPSCDEVCASLLTWVVAVNDSLGTAILELFLVFVLLPVFVFNYSVQTAQQEHNKEEIHYLRRLRTPKKAITEVMKMKNTLEDVFKPSFLLDRLVTALRAWLGADPALAACGPITEAEFDLTATRGVNDCLKQVMEPINEIKSSISCDRSETLDYGVGYMEDGEENREAILDEWKMLKFRNGLGEDSGRNYKVLFDLMIHTEDSWKLFKAWCKKEYKEQFEYITKSVNVDVQDGGQQSHLKENTPIYDILMPKGFSLTHVYMPCMPDDGRSLQIELSGSKQGDKAFWNSCDHLENNMKNAVVDDEEEDSDFGGSTLDRRLQETPIVARFALSEQYYNSMASAEVQRLCGGEVPQDFTAFVDRLLTPVVFEFPDTPQVDGKDMDNLLLVTGISVFMGDESPLRALLAALRSFVLTMRVWFECLGLAMLVPLVRIFTGASSLFPQPFTLWLVLNTVAIWICLVAFFSDFHFATSRLWLISQCLSLLEQKTLAQCKALKQSGAGNENGGENENGDEQGQGQGQDQGQEQAEGQAEGQGQEGGNGGEAKAEAERAAARAAKKAAEDTKPFDLTIEDAAIGQTDYDPASEFWVGQWREKHENVRNWFATVSYLRVFVSTSRLVAQTMLVAAAIIVGFLLLMSLMQVSADRMPPALKGAMHHALGGSLEFSAQAGGAAARRLHAELGEAMEALVENRHSLQPASFAAAGAAEPLSRAARRLQAELAPARAALHGVLLRQHDALAEGHAWLQELQLAPSARLRAARRRLAAAGGGKALEAAKAKLDDLATALDVSKATKTQIFTVVMVLFVMIYSVPLMWNIVKVNGDFDRHEDLLVKQRERHRISQAKREIRAKKTAEASEGAEDGSAQAASSGEAATPAADEAATPAASGPAAAKQAAVKDLECHRYERMLEMSIGSAHKSRERFPLKLFGFVITAQLLATWVLLVASPIFSQAKQMAPALAVEACAYLEGSPVVETLQKQMDLTNPSMHIKVKKMLHDNVCVPVKSAVSNQMSKLEGLAKGKAQQLAKGVDSKARRRLLALGASDAPFLPWADPGARAEALHEVPVPDLAAVVGKWWRAHPSHHPEARFAMAYTALQELGRDADRLLVASPAAVARAWRERAGEDLLAGFAAAMGAARLQLEAGAEGAFLAAEREEGERTEL